MSSLRALLLRFVHKDMHSVCSHCQSLSYPAAECKLLECGNLRGRQCHLSQAPCLQCCYVQAARPVVDHHAEAPDLRTLEEYLGTCSHHRSAQLIMCNSASCSPHHCSLPGDSALARLDALSFHGKSLQGRLTEQGQLHQQEAKPLQTHNVRADLPAAGRQWEESCSRPRPLPPPSQ